MGAATKIVYTIQDNKGKKSNMTIKVPSTLLLADYIGFAEEMGTLIDALTTGEIVNVGIAFTVDISGFGYTAAPGSTSDVEEVGLCSFRTAGGWRTSAGVPSLSDLKVTSGSDTLDETDQDVIDFLSAMTAGIALPVLLTQVNPCDSREDDIVSTDYARERFRASGKRR